MNLPDPQDLSKQSDEQLISILDNLFEPCTTLNSYLLSKIKSQKFNTYTELIEFCRVNLLDLLESFKKNEDDLKLKETICKIVSAHPRLGVPKKDKLSVHSQNEQKSLNSDNDNKELANALIKLNNEYEEKFPGLIFVVFVNGRTRNEIMELMKFRINNSNWLDEVKTAFNEMADIALDRARKLNAKL